MSDLTVLMAVTIDTEVDKSPDWTNPGTETYRSVLHGIPNLLTPLFEKVGARPTYLLSDEVIRQEECVEVLRQTPSCELGTHLHGDVVEPQRTLLDVKNQYIREMQCSYSREVEGGKLRNLTQHFQRAFGTSPISFRAGRFGAGPNTIALLEELGYLVDSSVTPGILWNYKEGRADFRSACDQPYHPSYEDITKEGEAEILEIPVSIVPYPYQRLLDQLSRRMKGSLCSLPDMLYCVWISPSTSDFVRMMYGINHIMRRGGENTTVVVNLMFHSMEIIPGASPASRTEERARAILERLRRVLELGKQKGFEFVTLRETIPFFDRKK